MSEDRIQWTLDLIEKLQRAGIGDPPRLSAIKFALESGRPIFESDKTYLKEKYKILQDQESGQISTETKDVSRTVGVEKSEPFEEDYSIGILKNRLAKGEITSEQFDLLKRKLIETDSTEYMKSEIKNMGKKLEEVKKEQSKRIKNLAIGSYKNEGTTTILSLLLGLVGVLGVGHMYVGRVGKGVGLLILGVFLIIVAVALSGAWSGISNCYECGIPLATGLGVLGFLIIFIIAYIVIWIWQIIDARKLCRQYNMIIDQYSS